MRTFLKLIVFFGFFCRAWATPTFTEEVVVLGSGPAGLSAAMYSARSGLSTTLIDGNEPGGQITLSYQVDNYPGFPEGITGFALSEKMMQQAKRFGAKIRSGSVQRVDLGQRPFTIHFDDDSTMQAKVLIVATGAVAKWLGIASEKALIGKGISSCALCDGAMYRDKEVVVIGGGDAALEDALFLTNYVRKVTLVHRRDRLRASNHLQEKAFANEKIRCIWDSEVSEILDPRKETVTGVKVRNRLNRQESLIPCEGVFVAIGHRPNTALFQGLLNMDQDGYLLTVPASTKTNIAGVFAAGDVSDKIFRQAITAAASGSMAAMEAYHFLQNYQAFNE